VPIGPGASLRVERRLELADAILEGEPRGRAMHDREQDIGSTNWREVVAPSRRSCSAGGMSPAPVRRRSPPAAAPPSPANRRPPRPAARRRRGSARRAARGPSLSNPLEPVGGARGLGHEAVLREQLAHTWQAGSSSAIGTRSPRAGTAP
jgi:hypothetical protein